jgi:hypothetical protein
MAWYGINTDLIYKKVVNILTHAHLTQEAYPIL